MKIVFLFFFVFTVNYCCAQNIQTSEAKKFIGKSITVCGKVVSIRVFNNKGRPTYIFFDKDYPNQTFAVEIIGFDNVKLGYTKDNLIGSAVCVTGKVGKWWRKPGMRVMWSDQIEKE
jgi:hypothetical protein